MFVNAIFINIKKINFFVIHFFSSLAILKYKFKSQIFYFNYKSLIFYYKYIISKTSFIFSLQLNSFINSIKFFL